MHTLKTLILIQVREYVYTVYRVYIMAELLKISIPHLTDGFKGELSLKVHC